MSIDIRDIIHDGVTANRAAEDLEVVSSPYGGFTEYHKKRVAKIAAPMANGAYARTIRIHELLHANRSPTTGNRKIHPIAYNAIEDARVHLIYWPDAMPQRANRDCKASALADMRSLQPMANLARAEDWNASLLVAFRALAILNRFGAVAHLDRLYRRMNAAFGPTITEKLCDILRLVRSRRKRAVEEFTALLRSDEQQSKPCKPGEGSHGIATQAPMRIVRLPMPESCDSAVRRTTLARSGARLNRARLARAIATGSTVGLFIRPRYLPGGTYLFDASGSMQLSESRLNELCRSVPAATVAYYSGWGLPKDDGAYGALTIYAEGGKRAAEIGHRYYNNDIDQYAIEWLLRQPAPRVYIGDGEFCGGPEGQDVRAATLLAAAVAAGKVTWQRTV